MIAHKHPSPFGFAIGGTASEIRKVRLFLEICGFQSLLPSSRVPRPVPDLQPVSNKPAWFQKQAACENQAEIPPVFEVSEIH